MKTFCFLVLILSILLFSCRKDSFITSPDAEVTITADTLKFDTVFVTSGSIYKYFTVKNDNNQKLLLSSIELKGGPTSYFKINVDGIAATQVNNIEILANDSIYVFVQVNVDQNSNNLPFVIRDSIQISFNGNTEFVQLEAWGQNAHFLRDKNILVNETWTNDLPYVILGSLTIDTSVTLTIDKGCRIYMHADAPIIVDGTILVNGQKDTANRVYFTGDRLDEPYKFYPASWPGLFFRGTSINNVFNYAVIKNSFQAIATRDLPLNANPKITLNETIIDNAFNTGILALNSSITARNTLISNCGSNVYLAKGGDYNFTHCTIVTIGNRYIDHKDPVLLVTNSFVENNVQVSANLNAVFRNCIIWGENGLPDDEVIVFKDGNTLFNVNFDYGLWKLNNPPSGPGIVVNQMISNQNPVFDSINTSANIFSFRLQSISPAIDKGTNTGIPIDLDGSVRPKGPLPDLGSYEKQ